ncbi:MAG: NADH-quinone oxidoreductase subunit H [Spirochaetia bacterium]|nr:NADH-quinone oxidoreductase subunit H [Spirochaetia bacterium]
MIKSAVLNILVVLFGPFIFAGIINRIKAMWAGRKGPKILQTLYDFIKYMKKGEVISFTVSPVFSLAPVVSLGAAGVAALVTPLAGGSAFVSIEGAFIIFAYMFALSKFAMLASAMETGSSFEGMGAAREATFTGFVEPAFFMTAGTAMLVSGSGSFDALSSFTASGDARGWLLASLAAAAFMIMLVTEGSRVPVDDPNTHLELTMIHEAMVLDNSGPAMALITYTANLKMLLIAALAAKVLIPANTGWLLSCALFMAVTAAAAAAVGCVESLVARLRMTHVPQFVFFMSSIALILFCAAFIFTMWGAV